MLVDVGSIDEVATHFHKPIQDSLRSALVTLTRSGPLQEEVELVSQYN